MNERTTISLEKTVVQILASYGRKGQSYNEIVSDILDKLRGNIDE